ncbi:MAG: hypothetical protein ABR609_13010 [Acidimicrobiia bacterium]
MIEGAVREYLGLDLLERLWSRNDMSEGEAMTLAQEAMRADRNSSG